MERKCTHPNCTNDHLARGFCANHYHQARKSGARWLDGRRGGSEPIGLAVRLWRKIDKRGPDECWPWTARHQIRGYGILGRGRRGEGFVLAHRAVWELTNGPIPESDAPPRGLVVMHICDNRGCCNPAHLRLGTQKENVQDMDNKGRRKVSVRWGNDHPGATITEDQARAIKADTKDGPKKTAERHAVPTYIVKNIRYGKSWSWI